MKDNNSRESMPALAAKAGLGLGVFLVTLNYFPQIAERLFAFPSASPSNPTSEHAASIYAALDSRSVTISAADIQIIESPFLPGEFSLPFHQVLALDWRILVAFGLALATLGALAVVVSLKFPKKAPSRIFLLTASLFAAGGTAITLAFVVHSGRADWDEAYLFASAAQNFATYGVPGVSVSGETGFSESSVDFLVIVTAGFLLWLFPNLLADTAVLASGLGLSCFTLILILLVLRRTIKLTAIQAFLVGSVIFLFPVWYLPFLSFMPTGLAVLAWTLFSITFYGALSGRNLSWASLVAAAMLLVRWDLGIMAITAVTLAAGYSYISMTYFPTRGVVLTGKHTVLIPIALLVVTTTWRIVTFGSPIPSGLLGKSVGLDSAFIRGGINYFHVTLIESFWLLSLILLLMLAYSRIASPERSSLALTTLVISVPSFTSILSGGDWFPIEWARYTAPTALGIAILSLGLALRAPSDSRETERHPLLHKGIALTATLLLIVPSSVGAFERLQVDASSNTRVVCLAKAGFSLAKSFPNLGSVASAEVNTVAYYAEASLTDLIGIVDPRIANSPLAPWSSGDILHRRADHQLLFDDNSDAIYLYEGADCSQKNFSLEDNVEQWNTLLNSGVTRYRVGDPQRLLDYYTPVTIVIPEQLVALFLVRKHITRDS